MDKMRGVSGADGHAPKERVKERVRRIQVRLVTRDEMPRWKDPMARHHYVGQPDIVLRRDGR